MTTTAHLTDRYVDAVVRAVPDQQRQEVGTELRTLIADQVDARIESGEPPEEAETAVLTELGDPAILAAGYADRPLHLIGPRYYLAWLRLLKVLLAIIVPLAGIGVTIGQIFSGAGVGEILGTVASTVVSVIFGLTFWVTVVFAALERTGVSAEDAGHEQWTPDELPEPGDTGAGVGELVATLTFLAIAGFALVWDHVHGLALIDGEWMSVFHADLWPVWILGLLALLVLDAVLAVLVFTNRGWTPGLAVANVVLNVAFAVPALWLVLQHRLFDPAFLDALSAATDAGLEGGLQVATSLIALGIVAVCGWDSVDGFRKARRRSAARARSDVAPSH